MNIFVLYADARYMTIMSLQSQLMNFTHFAIAVQICGKAVREMANKDRITELENELKLMKEQLYRLCACLYPQALEQEELEFIVTGKRKGGAE